MPVHTRNLILFAALSLAAVLTGVIARGPSTIDSAVVAPGAAAHGYYLLDAAIDIMAEDGTIAYTINAERVDQQPDTEDFVLQRMSVEYAPTSNIRWGLSADGGYMPKDRSYFELDEVLLYFDPDSGGRLVSFETSWMRLDVDNLLASTDQPVVFRRGDSRLQAIGMTVDLRADSFELKSDVTTQITR